MAGQSPRESQSPRGGGNRLRDAAVAVLLVAGALAGVSLLYDASKGGGDGSTGGSGTTGGGIRIVSGGGSTGSGGSSASTNTGAGSGGGGGRSGMACMRNASSSNSSSSVREPGCLPAFGSTPDDKCGCRYLCARMGQHARALLDPHPLPRGGDATLSFEDIAAALTDDRPARCNDYAAVLASAAAAGCACDGGSVDACATAAPAGLSVGSPALVDWLHDAVVYHDYMAAWVAATLAGTRGGAIPPPPPFDTSRLRRPTCARPLPSRPRATLVYCPYGGGVADKTKGTMMALLMTLLHPTPQAFYLHCRVLVDLRTAWMPHDADAGFRLAWVPPERLVDGFPIAPLVSRAVAWENSADVTQEAFTTFFEPTNADITVVNANFLVGRVFRTPAVRAYFKAAYASPTTPPECGLPPEMWALIHGVGDNEPLDSPLPPRDPLVGECAAAPAPAVPVPVSREASVLAAAGCSGTAWPTPPTSVALRTGWASPTTTLATQLLPWLFAASPALQARVAELAPVLRGDSGSASRGRPPAGTAVIAVHIRVGTPEPGSGYSDPARDPPEAAADAALLCGAQTLRALAARSGTPRRVVFFVSTDNHDATRAFTAALARGTLHGIPAVVAALNVTSRTLHTGNTPGDLVPVEELRAAFITLHAEVVLLSIGHGMVRSRSGFSEMAAAMGRLPMVYQLDLGRRFSAENTVCIDMSALSFQTTSNAGTHLSNLDATLFDLPQFAIPGR